MKLGKRMMNELDRDIREHIERETQENVERGMSPEEARTAAMRKFGNVGRVKEETRGVWSWVRLEELLRDVKYGLRMLRKAPGFATVAVLTLALGIGANTAIFSVIESVMFKPLPFSGADRIVRVYETQDGHRVDDQGGPSPMDMRDFARLNHSFEAMLVYDTWRKNVSFSDKPGEPEQMMVGLVSGEYFEALGMKPKLGRLFTDDESYVGKHYLAVINTRIWKTRFASDPSILGRKILINDEPYAIVAVMPDVIPQWMDNKAPEIWTPFEFLDTLGDLWTEGERGRGRGWYSLGRIKPGVSMKRAQADLATVAAGLAAAHPVDKGIGVALEKLSDTRADNLRSMLLLLMGAVSLILLIACVNLANLLLARNAVRERELAMRAALGAGRGRLVSQMLVETLLLSVLGGGLGLVLAQAGVGSLARMHPQDMPQLASLGIDWRVLMFTFLVSVATTLIFGLGPALTGARLNLVEALKLGSRTVASGSNAQRMRNVLVVTEMAMSLMLLVGAGLLVQSIVRLQRQALGIRANHLMTGHFYLPPVRYPNAGTIVRFSDQFADKVRALPGVVDASISTTWPPTYRWAQMFEIPGHTVTREQDIPWAQCGFVDWHFLRTMGIPLVSGRDFNESDAATSPAVVLVSQELVRQYFPKQDPIGLRIHIGPPSFLGIPPGANITDSADVTIVGVISDFRNNGLVAPPEPQIIALYSQHPLVTYGFRDIVVRTAADPHLMIPEITRQLHAMDAELPFAQTRTIDEIVEQQTGSQRFMTTLLGLFAAAGLALAAVGIYGVVSFLVAQRRHELAIRAAVGASAQNILWLVLKEGVRMAAIGAFVGMAGAIAAQKLISGMLFGVSAIDPLTFAGAAVFLVAVVMIACSLPAWRASRVDPCSALRAD
ncbi:MAG TPA: ABC transporter permease [Candidatus Acidoferrales bacterium]|nr:ABC transporter permease [Candidatus Acidoferrales bacterium]